MVLDVGQGVTDLEMGDEVWGCVSEWNGGAATELLTIRRSELLAGYVRLVYVTYNLKTFEKKLIVGGVNSVHHHPSFSPPQSNAGLIASSRLFLLTLNL